MNAGKLGVRHTPVCWHRSPALATEARPLSETERPGSAGWPLLGTNNKPAGANGGQVTRSRQPSCPLDHITSQIGEQLDELRRLVEQFDKSRDYRAWEVAQKALLNAQAIAVAAGWRR